MRLKCIFCFVLISFLLFSVLGCSSQKKVNFEYGLQESITVVIDAGHGGIDGGVQGRKTGAIESEINLAITKKLAGIFEEHNFKVVLTRKGSGGLYGYLGAGFKKRDMKARENIINQANASMVISIHQNKFSSPNRRGAQVFYAKGSKRGKELAFFIQNSLNCNINSQKKYTALAGDYYILNCSPCPSVIVECGFLSNEQDEGLLITEEYQTKVATTIFYGCMQFILDNSNLS